MRVERPSLLLRQNTKRQSVWCLLHNRPHALPKLIQNVFCVADCSCCSSNTLERSQRSDRAKPEVRPQPQHRMGSASLGRMATDNGNTGDARRVGGTGLHWGGTQRQRDNLHRVQPVSKDLAEVKAKLNTRPMGANLDPALSGQATAKRAFKQAQQTFAEELRQAEPAAIEALQTAVQDTLIFDLAEQLMCLLRPYHAAMPPWAFCDCHANGRGNWQDDKPQAQPMEATCVRNTQRTLPQSDKPFRDLPATPTKDILRIAVVPTETGMQTEGLP